MRPPLTMEATVNKVRYRVGNSELIAHDSYWDGSNFDRHGRNTFLYKSPRGRYFAVHLTLWQGERDHIEPLSEEDAYNLYERLPVKELTPEEAFSLSIEEA